MLLITMYTRCLQLIDVLVLGLEVRHEHLSREVRKCVDGHQNVRTHRRTFVCVCVCVCMRVCTCVDARMNR